MPTIIKKPSYFLTKFYHKTVSFLFVVNLTPGVYFYEATPSHMCTAISTKAVQMKLNNFIKQLTLKQTS